MIGLKAADLKTQKMETLVVPVCADRKIHDDRALNAVIQKALKLKEFKADKEERVTLFDVRGLAADRVMCVGLGKLNKIDLDVLRSFCGSAVDKCIQSGFETVWVAVPAADRLKMESPDVVEAMMEGACLGNHIFDRYKKEKKKKPLKQINFCIKPQATVKLRTIAPRVRIVCAGTILAREWISMPSNEKTPERFTRSRSLDSEASSMSMPTTALAPRSFAASWISSNAISRALRSSFS